MKLKHFRFIAILVLFTYAMFAHAAQYNGGITKWQAGNGKLVMMTGVLTDNARYYYLNYTFYWESVDNTKGDTFMMIPIVKDKEHMGDPGYYDLNFSTFNGAGVTMTDAEVIVKGNKVWLVTGHKDAVNGYTAPGVVTTRVYQLFEGGEAEWSYYFALVPGGKKYPDNLDYTVENALSETAKHLH